MQFIVYFDIAALALLVFLIFSIISRRQFRGLCNKLYFAIAVATLITTTFDILASLNAFGKDALFAFNSLYYFSRSSIPILMFLYATGLVEIYPKLKRKPGLLFSILVPFLVIVVCLIVNIWTKWMFDYLDGPTYQRGPLVVVVYVVAYLYGAASLVVLFVSHKVRNRTQLLAAISAFAILIAASVTQIFIDTLLVEMFATAFGLIILSVFVENPDNLIDDKTQHFGFTAFASDTKDMLLQKKAFSTVFIHATNAATMYNLFTYKEAVEFIRYCSHVLADRVTKVDRTNVVYYLGQSTFVYVFTDKSKSQEILGMVTDYFNSTMTDGQRSFHFNAKICLAEAPEDIHDLQGLIAFSSSFYEFSDSNSINIVPFRSPAGNALFEIDKILERAIRDKSFSIYYQPIYSIKEKRFVSAEALLRLNDPEYGMIMPGLMIPYAERHGKMGAIGDIVLEKSFAFLSEHIKDQLDYLEVNLSSMQLLEIGLIDRIRDLAITYSVRPEQVIFEITESVAIMDNPEVVDNIIRLTKAGFRVAIDDFGTGYSNIARLVHLPFVTLKFDKSMTDLLVEDTHDDFFLDLFRLTHRSGVQVLLEGVETKELVDKTSAMGADYIQGYYFSRALDEGQMLEFLAKHPK